MSKEVTDTVKILKNLKSLEAKVSILPENISENVLYEGFRLRSLNSSFGLPFSSYIIFRHIYNLFGFIFPIRGKKKR